MKITFKTPEVEAVEKFDRLFPVKNCFIEVIPGNVILPRKYMEIAEAVKSLPIFDDDIWLISYPRTGLKTTTDYYYLKVSLKDQHGHKKWYGC